MLQLLFRLLFLVVDIISNVYILSTHQGLTSGVGGVFVSMVLLVLKGDPVPTWQTIFALTPYHLLTAAVFGLAPNLLMQSLKKQVKAQKPEV